MYQEGHQNSNRKVFLKICCLAFFISPGYRRGATSTSRIPLVGSTLEYASWWCRPTCAGAPSTSGPPAQSGGQRIQLLTLLCYSAPEYLRRRYKAMAQSEYISIFDDIQRRKQVQGGTFWHLHKFLSYHGLSGSRLMKWPLFSNIPTCWSNFLERKMKEPETTLYKKCTLITIHPCTSRQRLTVGINWR